MADGCSEHISNYAPDPKETFLQEKKYIVCPICQDVKLKPFPRRGETGDPVVGEYENPALLPCGHLFCIDCIAIWLNTNLQCPKCRLSLKHELCKHPVLPYILTADDIFGAPGTIPKGGKIQDQCPPCRKLTDRRTAYSLYQELRKDLVEAPEGQKEAKRRHMDSVMRSFVGDQHPGW
ncbi:hypothetical protein B0T14DRAFT_430572 [Immersiella caudata]|uniref:RING-type domain-containing protein n=1 Tax=Immersiella caudata TaxID=314043 RepID=A0AA39WS54_9PEZI|nr:hypothetical protein B0T14DRAFT_430572 [Immersiella caudata]